MGVSLIGPVPSVCPVCRCCEVRLDASVTVTARGTFGEDVPSWVCRDTEGCGWREEDPEWDEEIKEKIARMRERGEF